LPNGLFQNLAGYLLERQAVPLPRGKVRASGCLVLIERTLGEPDAGMVAPIQQPLDKAHHQTLQLRPIGRLIPVAGRQLELESMAQAPEPQATPTVHTLRLVRGGQAYRVTSPAARGLVRPELAEALETIFERVARERGFTPEKPLEIQLSRGFKADSHDHGEGRAADITSVGSKALREWKREWEQAMAAAGSLPEPEQQAEATAAEQQRNLGYGLYKALQAHGGWRVNKDGWRPYRGVMQLFGPWTATEGPWKAMRIENPNAYQQQRLADQRSVFRAHQDHVHVAR
jgi:hypothetical protein